MSDDAAREAQKRPSGGLIESLRAMVASLVAIAHTRIELLGTEVEEQIERLASILLWGLVALFTAFLAIVLASVALIVLFWETHRGAVAVTLTVLFVVLAALAAWGFVTRVRARPRLFASTLDELAKDHERLGGE